MQSLAPESGGCVADVRFDENTLGVDLVDGRCITIPLA
jgi:hypothetical protein